MTKQITEQQRMTGTFYTPEIWAHEAHQMLSEALGDDWKEKYIVWDCACGLANLTRDYTFKKLYLSTLEQDDVDTIRSEGYNPGATVFQYDFINEVSINSVPDSLKQAFKDGKKVVFLINPPYGTANNMGAVGTSKEGVAKTTINAYMRKAKIGSPSQQLYAQFMYKIARLKQVYGNQVVLGIFSKPTFITSSSYGKFRDFYYDNFDFVDGILLCAGHFADVSDAWGISFTIWKNGTQNSTDIILKLKDSNNHFEIEQIGTKELYAPNALASHWAREGVKGLKTIDVPQLCSAVKLATCKSLRGSSIKGAIGYMNNCGNNVYQNGTKVGLYSSACNDGNGFPILPVNFNRAIVLFVARKTIKGNWINDKDEYMPPNTDHPEYKQWNNDALVYSLFNNSSQQSALRDITYKDKQWDVQNEWFWMSNAEMRSLADEHGFAKLLNDAKRFDKDRFVFNMLSVISISPDAQEVLNAARELVKLSFTKRQEFHEEHPEQHLNAWDAGWSQSKPLFKKHYKEEHNAFIVKYKSFDERMREGVYKFGFLK